MELPPYHSPEVERYANAVSAAIGRKRMEVASVLNDVPPEALAIAEELERLSGKWNPVELYTADNFFGERDVFLEARARGESHVPTFRYGRALAFDVEGSRTVLQALRDRASGLPRVSERDWLAVATLRAKIDDDLATCEFVEGIQLGDDVKVGRGLAAKYPGSDDGLYAFAEAAFEDVVTAKEEALVPCELSEDERRYLEKELKLSPEQEAEAYRSALREYGMLRETEDGEGFLVVVDDSITALDVRDKSAMGPTVFVPGKRDEPLSAMEVCALLTHEIEAHARQAMNGKKLFGIGGGGGREDDETLYEGLAVRYEWDFVERYFGKVRYDMDLSTLYVFATRMAEEGRPFADIFEDQLSRITALAKSPASSLHEKDENFCRNKAFRMAYRVLRGHTDMSNAVPFAMTKDLAYLRGWLMDQELLKNNLGHANEVAIMPTSGLDALARMDLKPEDVPLKFKDFAPTYMRTLLARRPAKD